MSKPKKVVRVSYKTQKFLVSKEDIDNGTFMRLLNKRNHIKSTVDGVFKNLLLGKNFEAPLVVNKVGNKYQLIDGNNRFDAMEQYIGLDPGNKVEATMHVYEGLTDEQLKTEYTIWNKGKKQTTNDVVKQYEEDIPIFSMFKKDFPLPIGSYPSVTAMAFYRLVGAYFGCQGNEFKGGYAGTPFAFVEKAQELELEDYAIMKAFIKDHMEIFGPFRNNPWYTSTPLTAMMRIWMDNKSTMNRSKFIGYTRAKIVNEFEARELIKSSGIGATKWARTRYILMLNNGRTSDIFV